MVVGFTTNYAISDNHHWWCGLESRSGRCVLDTTLCDKVCQWLAAGQWFSPNTLVSSTNKTDRHDEILLKVAFNTIKQTTNAFIRSTFFWGRGIQTGWYQRGNQWPQNKQGLKDKHWSTKHYIEIRRSSNTKPTKDLGEPRCTKRVCSSCSTR